MNNCNLFANFILNITFIETELCIYIYIYIVFWLAGNIFNFCTYLTYLIPFVSPNLLIYWKFV